MISKLPPRPQAQQKLPKYEIQQEKEVLNIMIPSGKNHDSSKDKKLKLLKQVLENQEKLK